MSMSDYYPYQPGYCQAGEKYHELQYSDDCYLGKYICQMFEIDRPHYRHICILPDGCNDILVKYDGTQVHCWLSPSITKPMAFHFEQPEWLFGVRFYPGTTQAFFSSSFAYDAKEPIALEKLLPHAKRIERDLQQSKSFARRHEIMESFLRDSLKGAAGIGTILEFCVKKLIETNGMISMDALAQQAGYGTRYIRQLFSENVGHSTKELAKIIRFQKTLQYIDQHPDEKLKNIAAKFGFSDHSHMNRELHRFLGITSSRIKAHQEWNAILKSELTRLF